MSSMIQSKKKNSTSIFDLPLSTHIWTRTAGTLMIDWCQETMILIFSYQYVEIVPKLSRRVKRNCFIKWSTTHFQISDKRLLSISFPGPFSHSKFQEKSPGTTWQQTWMDEICLSFLRVNNDFYLYILNLGSVKTVSLKPAIWGKNNCLFSISTLRDFLGFHI